MTVWNSEIINSYDSVPWLKTTTNYLEQLHLENYSAVTVAIFGFAVGFGRIFLIQTAVYGRIWFLWFQMLITHTAYSEN